MQSELTALAVASALGLVHIILASHSQSLVRGYLWTGSARDEPVLPLTGLAGRLERANRNYLETFPFFAAAVLAAALLGAGGETVILASWTYVGARVAYLIAYASGVFLLRSLIWNVATLAIIVLMVAPFLSQT